MKKRFAVVDTVPKGIFAEVARAQCVGCGLCAKACPASVIEIMQEETP